MVEQPTQTVLADRLHSRMKIFHASRWERIHTVEFGLRTVIRCERGAVLTVDPQREFTVMLKAGGGYDFSERLPEMALALSA